MVHRALLGSLERFFGVLIEHYGGAFPLWLAPEQVRVLPLTEKQLEYAERVAAALREKEFRATVDRRSEKVGAKIRTAQLEKLPYMIIVGPREVEQETLSVRCRKDGDLGSMSLDDLAAKLEHETTTKGL
jgi:threonyl-tRNA synthetase